jgi:hypothetical protein
VLLTRIFTRAEFAFDPRDVCVDHREVSEIPDQADAFAADRFKVRDCAVDGSRSDACDGNVCAFSGKGLSDSAA